MRATSVWAGWALAVVLSSGCGSDDSPRGDASQDAGGQGGPSRVSDAGSPGVAPSAEVIAAADALSLAAESAVNAAAYPAVQKGLSSCASVRPQTDLSVQVTLEACVGPSGLFTFTGEIYLKRARTEDAFSVWTGSAGVAYAADEAALDAALAEATAELGLSLSTDLVSYAGLLRIPESSPALARVDVGAAVSLWGEAQLGASGEPATVVTVADTDKLTWDLSESERCACPSAGTARLANSSEWEHALLVSFEAVCGSVQVSFEDFDTRCADDLDKLPEETVTACSGGASDKQRRSCETDEQCVRGQACIDGTCATLTESDAGTSLPDLPESGDALSGCAQECADIATMEGVLAAQCTEADGSRFGELVDAGVSP